MRRVLAWLLLAAGAAAAVTGALLLTVLAPPQRLTAAAPAGAAAPLTVTDRGVLDLTGSPVTVRATGPGDVFLGVARTADAEAWLDGAARTRVTGVAGDLDDPRLTTADEPGGEAGAPPDPRAADVWALTAGGEGSAELVWDPAATGAPDRTGAWVLLATSTSTGAGDETGDGAAGATTAVDSLRLTWSLSGDDARHPAGTPLLLAGAAVLVLGAVGVLVEERRARRARRARHTRGTRGARRAAGEGA
ncbi:hypothetical protein [Kineococcus sp. SYSU DK004]|uniref:hypothetical protein n=1 Tax=Kineococcus sp. SYSU DK004 TaxID=3383125 RepID=UPI003D7C4BB0